MSKDVKMVNLFVRDANGKMVAVGHVPAKGKLSPHYFATRRKK